MKSFTIYLGLSLALVTISACGGGGGGQGGAGAQGGSDPAGTGGGGSGGGGTGGGGTGGGSDPINCTGNDPMFPDFSKSCQVNAECVVKFHQVNCCGTRIAIGLSTSSSQAFDEAEAKCVAMYPECGCAAMPTEAEDGKSTDDDNIIMAECSAGSCSSFVP